tara:strand:- start:2070 stop:2246 length:177 start_codon:yes stop_codon:yes gene_type:complete
MNNKEITFLEKIQLYKRLTTYLKIASQSNTSSEEVEAILKDLERWGVDLRKRANYYDI